MKLRIVTKKCSRVCQTVSKILDFTAYGRKRDHPPARELFSKLDEILVPQGVETEIFSCRRKSRDGPLKGQLDRAQPFADPLFYPY